MRAETNISKSLLYKCVYEYNNLWNKPVDIEKSNSHCGAHWLNSHLSLIGSWTKHEENQRKIFRFTKNQPRCKWESNHEVSIHNMCYVIEHFLTPFDWISSKNSCYTITMEVLIEQYNCLISPAPNLCCQKMFFAPIFMFPIMILVTFTKPS